MRGNARFGVNYESKPRKESKPILSEDQFEEMQKLVLEASINKNEVEFTIYKNGELKKETGIIVSLNNQRLVLNPKKVIYFCEIIRVRKVDF